MSDLIPWYPMIIPIMLWIVELCLTALWLPVLFRSGLPLFRQSFVTTRIEGLQLDTDRLNQEFVNLTHPSLLFHKVSETEMLFREAIQFRPLGYAPLVRGRIFHEPQCSEITITGRMNWIMVLVLVLVVVTFLYAGLQLFEPRYVFATILVVFPIAIAVTGIFQISRFRKVAYYLQKNDF